MSLNQSLEEVRKNYTDLTNSNFFVGNKPVSFDLKNFNKCLVYYLTLKLDGKRMFLFIDKGGNCYYISQRMKFINLDVKVSGEDYGNTLIDGELFKDYFYIFDILFYRGKETREEQLTTRIDLMKMIYLELKKTLKIRYKEYYKSGTLLEDFLTLKKTYDSNKFTYDGILFVSNQGYYKSPLKWKTPEKITVDFKIVKKPTNLFYIYTSDDRLFRPKKYPFISGIIPVNEKDYLKYKNGVVEFSFDPRRKIFKPLRQRYDKPKANNYYVIMKNLDLVMNPIDMETLLSS